MRNTLVPQAGQSPLVAGRPFFKVTCSGLVISRFSRHFRQYASMINPHSLNDPINDVVR